MIATTSTITFAPHQSSPLARTRSPFKDPRPAPHTPGRTAQLWDEYERMAVEKARRREGKPPLPHSQRCSAADIPRNCSTNMPSARSSFDYKFRTRLAVATCKNCKHPITCSSGLCEPCKKTFIPLSSTRESTPPLSPTACTFPPMDPNSLHKKPPPPPPQQQQANPTLPIPTSPKQTSVPSPTNPLDLPIRLSSLRPPRTLPSPPRTRKPSLTDPNDPFLRLKTTQSPTPTTPPPPSHSRSTSSITNTPGLPSPIQAYTRHHSITPSDLSSLSSSSPYTCRPSVSSTRYALARSAWDSWDSEDEGDDARGEKGGLVTYFRRAARKKGGGNVLEKEKNKDKEKGEEGGKRERKKRFVRVLSCGVCS